MKFFEMVEAGKDGAAPGVCGLTVSKCNYREKGSRRLRFLVLKALVFHQFHFCSARRGLGVYIDWTWKRKLSPRGGRYFFHRVELAVPSFRQFDEKWRDDPLGGIEENGTLGGEGCAVAAAAMVFKFYGVETDPQQLNWFLPSVEGYTENGWIYWDRAAWFAPDRVRHVYEDLASYQLIDSNLARGNPVIVRVRLAERHHAFCRHRRQGRVRLPRARSRRRLCERPLSTARAWQRYRGAAILRADRECGFRECEFRKARRGG